MEQTKKDARLVIRAFNHELRISIIEYIRENQGEAGITSGEIFQGMRIEQTVCSLHLGKLRRAGLVKSRRAGKYIFYTFDKECMDKIKSAVNTLFPLEM